jgi:transcriptional regulator with XRE-family HTH domain
MITRIRELLEARQLSPTQFADLIGVGRPVISHILSERNKPSLEVVQKIIGAFPDISLPWLLAGTGPMLVAAVASPVAPSTNSTNTETLQAPIAVSAVPPSPLTAPPVSSATPPRLATVPQPNHYPQPPRFRPGAPAAITPTRVATALPPVEAPATAANSVAAVVDLPSPSSFTTVAVPVTNLAPDSTLAAPIQTASLPTPAVPTPSSMPNENPGVSNSLDVPTAATLASSINPEASTPSSNPAAALSFLGEPGKAIRRIVIFYRDGSFSDYLPEGN